MPQVLIELAYLGSDYHGWQVQKNARSVQSTVQSALSELCSSQISLTGCSRTDAGVHARSYFALANGDIPASLLGARLANAMNVRLPSDISVKGVYGVCDGFHPRYSVESKEYEYVIYDGRCPDPFLSGRSWHSGRVLDHELMNKNAKDFIGEFDFTAFCATGSKTLENGDCVRKVYSASVKRDNDTVRFRVCANGFLYNMVRIMAGTLAEISLGRLEDGCIPKIIESRDRVLAGRTLPAQGLYLDRVTYKEGDIKRFE